MMKVYFDANFSQYIAKAINQLEIARHEIEVIVTNEALRDGASDEEIVKYVADNNGVLFTKDSDFKKAKLITELMKSHDIGLFYMKTPKKEIYWETIVTIVKAYKDAREVILNKTPPYYYEIKPNGKIKEGNL